MCKKMEMARPHECAFGQVKVSIACHQPAFGFPSTSPEPLLEVTVPLFDLRRSSSLTFSLIGGVKITGMIRSFTPA